MNKLIALLSLAAFVGCNNNAHTKPKFHEGDIIRVVESATYLKSKNCTGVITDYFVMSTRPNVYVVRIRDCWIRRSDGFIKHVVNDLTVVNENDVAEIK